VVGLTPIRSPVRPLVGVFRSVLLELHSLSPSLNSLSDQSPTPLFSFCPVHFFRSRPVVTERATRSASWAFAFTALVGVRILLTVLDVVWSVLHNPFWLAVPLSRLRGVG